MFSDLSRKLFLLQPDSVLLCCGGCQFNYKRDAVHWCSSLSHAVIQSVPGLQFCKTSANGNRQCTDPWGWRAIGTGRGWSPTAYGRWVCPLLLGQIAEFSGRVTAVWERREVAFTETLGFSVPWALVSTGPWWEGCPRAHALLGLLGGSLQGRVLGQRRGKADQTALEQGSVLCLDTWQALWYWFSGFAPPLQEFVE